ncbi:MAG: leucyl/phenylalanyl-tRNA---protein transferase [Candidatus Hydrogenedentes bacterium]|nr:leucyl/phenylalanyl-tRNA---protein transferase [Candidatus Hydrogenedentota bacterium]
MPVFRLTKELVFPLAEWATEEGLLAVGGDLSVERLLLAYSNGIFPWYSDGDPILWWSPDPRLVLFPNEFHLSRRLRRILRRGTFRITMDQAFQCVIEACAEAPRPGQDGTWITSEMIEAYCGLHRAGYAHSVECWVDDDLVGGLYGVSLGRCFFGESMFHRRADASKVAMAALTGQLQAWGFDLIDCQVVTPLLVSLGAREIPRAQFIECLREGICGATRCGTWFFDTPSGEIGSDDAAV